MARRNHLDEFTLRRIIGKLEEGRTVTSVAAEFGINKSVVSRAWKAFQTTGTAVRKVGGGRPRTTTAGDDRYIILQAKRGQQQSANAIAQQLCTAVGQQLSRFTMARRLHKGGLFALRPERCLPLKVGHRLQWCREHKNWTTDQWSRILFMDESRFSTRRDSQRVLIWKDIRTQFYPSNIKKKHSYSDHGVLVWGGIMLNGRTELHIFNRGSAIRDRYNLNFIQPVRDALRRRIAALLHHPENTQQLKQMLIEEWALLPQEMLHQLVLSRRRRCEATIALWWSPPKNPFPVREPMTSQRSQNFAWENIQYWTLRCLCSKVSQPFSSFDPVNSTRRAASPLVRLVEGEEKWEASEHHQAVLPPNWGVTEQNRTVTCMVFKATAIDRCIRSSLQR
ncbi:transposable element Tcb2 transposase [Trichonephila clavipes]|nr:transposable element Tcb2 transposase [Trichonephila clavipes]